MQQGRVACAFLSKLPLQNPVDIVNFPPEVLALRPTDDRGIALQRMGRGALQVRVTKGGFTTDLISVHLKSKLLTFPAPNGGSFFSTNDESVRARAAAVALIRRTAEAATVRIASNAIVEDTTFNALAFSATSTTAPPPPPPKSSKAPTAANSTPAVSTAPTKATTPASGTSPP